MKKNLVVSIISFVSSFFVGGAAAFGAGRIGSKNASDSSFEDNDFIDDYPQDDTVEETPFSKLLSSIVSAQEIVFDDAEILLSPDAIRPIRMNLSDVYVMKANESYQADIKEAKVYYNNNLQADVAIRYEGEKIYLNFLSENENKKANAYTLSVSKTLDGFTSLFSALGISGLSMSGTSVSFDDILNELTKALANVETQALEQGSSYLLTIPDLVIGDITLSGMKITLLSDENNHFIGGSIAPFKLLLNDSSTIEISVSASAHLNTDSTNQGDTDGFSDISDATGSIFTTLAKLSNAKIGKFDIQADTEIKGRSFGLDGSLFINAKNTFMDFSRSEYYLDLSHYGVDASTSLNSIQAHYKDDTIYLGLNDLFKGYLKKSSLSDLFDYMDEVLDATSGETRTQKVFSSISDMLNVVIQDVDIPSLEFESIDLDSFRLPEAIESFTYHENSDFTLVIKADYFNFGDSNITIKANFQTAVNDEGEETETELKSLSVSGIEYEDIRLKEITLSPHALTESEYEGYLKTQVEKEKTEYSPYDSTLTIFRSLSNLLGSKKIHAGLSLSYKDNDHQADYTANMDLSADMTSLVQDSTLDIKTVDGLINYYNRGKYGIGLSLNVSQDENVIGNDNQSVVDKITHSQGHNLQLDYQNSNLFASYNYDNVASDYVFRQYMPDSQFGKLKTVIDSYSKQAQSTASDSDSENVSSSLTEIGSIIDVIANSSKLQALKTSIQNASLKELDDVLSLSSDGTHTQITLDPSSFLAGSPYANSFSVLQVTVSSTLDILSLSGSLSYNKNSLSFTLSLDDDIRLASFPTNDEAIQALGYVKLDNADNLLSAFMAMPTSLKKFGLRLEGSLNILSDESKSSLSIGKNEDSTLSSEARIDASNGIDDMTMEGQIHIQHDSLFNSSAQAYQNLEFQYNTTEFKDQIVCEYNDKMRMKIDKETLISGSDSVVSKLKAIPSDNLLLRYFGKLNTTDSSLPLMDLIQYKDPAKLLRYSYIQKVEITDTQIVISIDRKLFDKNDDSKEADVLTIRYSGTGSSAKIDSINLKGQYGSSMEIVSVTATLLDYDDVSPVSFNENANILDMNGISTLTTCLIDTTENNYFEFSPSTLSVTLMGIGINVTLSGQVYVCDNHAYAYLRFQKGSVSSVQSSSFYLTEYFVMEENIWVNQTRTTSSWGTKTYHNEHFKITKDELLSNIVYYLLQYTCDFGSGLVDGIAIDQIYSALNDSSEDSDVTISDDFSSLITSVTTGTDYFEAVLEPKNLIDIPMVSIGTTTIKVGFNADTTGSIQDHRFTSVTFNTSISLLSLFTVSIKNFQVSLTCEKLSENYSDVIKSGGKMNRFYEFVSLFESNYSSNYSGIGYDALNQSHQDTSILGFYAVNPTSHSSINANGNSKSSSTKSYTDVQNNLFYYHD